MYTDINVEGFRGISNLRIGKLNGFNLITGPNNVGKTTLLEALFVHGGGGNAVSLELTTEGLRGLPGLQASEWQAGRGMWDAFFHGFDPSRRAIITVKRSDGNSRVVEVGRPTPRSTIQEIGPSSDIRFPSTPLRELQIRVAENEGEQEYVISAFQDRVQIIPSPHDPWPVILQIPYHFEHERLNVELGRALDEDRLDDILAGLRCIDERVSDLRIQPYGGLSLIHVSFGKGTTSVPIHLVGTGFARVLMLLLYTSRIPSGVLCIDEIEFGLHYSTLNAVIKTVHGFAKSQDVQIFATTHSDETIRSVLAAFDGSHELKIIRLSRNANAVIKVHDYDVEKAKAAQDLKLSLR